MCSLANFDTMFPKISVIIPVYNAEPYLHQCIDSILAQSFTNYEILLIDDGSKDKSSEICDEYAVKDSRIKVFHKENGGVSSTRNLGIDKAQGKWITFVDSDDFLGNSYLNDLLTNSESCELVVCGLSCINSKNVFSPPHVDKINISKKSAILDKIITNLYFTGPYSKLFRTDIIQSDKIRFNTHFRLSEDLLFLLTYLSKIQIIHLVQNCSYHYRDDFKNMRFRYRLNLESYLYNSNHLQLALNKLKEHTNYDFPNLNMYIKNNEIGHFYYHLFSLDKYSIFAREVRGFKKGGGTWYVNSFKKKPFVFLLKYFPRLAYSAIRIARVKYGR